MRWAFAERTHPCIPYGNLRDEQFAAWSTDPGQTQLLHVMLRAHLIVGNFPIAKAEEPHHAQSSGDN